jgi:ADP-heptose:LPS heptosyltransferase
MNKDSSIIVKRCHGLGNVILLLPALDYLCDHGTMVSLVTRPEWVEAFSSLRPNFKVIAETESPVIDLDAMTSEVYPTQHRSDELARLLGINAEIPSVRISHTPEQWSEPFEHLRGSVIFAPEAQHPSRAWPVEHCRCIKKLFQNDQLVLVGTERNPEIACDADLRGRLELTGLLGVIAMGKAVITMDSAVLHIAAAMGKPAVAIFGGVDARYRIRPDQSVVVLQSPMACCPCNKREDCDERFDCIKSIEPVHVRQAFDIALKNKGYLDFYKYTNISE